MEFYMYHGTVSAYADRLHSLYGRKKESGIANG